MASSVFLRSSLAAAKRPLAPFQLGTSTSSVPTHHHVTSITYHTRPDGHVTFSPLVHDLHIHAQKKARRSATNFAYVPGGRTSPIFPPFGAVLTTSDGRLILQ